MFDWFESHANGSRHRGAGLGLSLVRSFVELHGGKVRVDSDVGKGTTVSVRLPARPDRPSQRRRMTRSDRRFSRRAYRNETATAHLMADLALLIGAGRRHHAVRRSRRRQDLRRAGHDPLSRRRRDARSAEPDIHAGADLRSAALSVAPCRPLPHQSMPDEMEEIGLSPLPEDDGGPDRMAGTRAGARCLPTASTSRSATVLRWARPRAPRKSPAMARRADGRSGLKRLRRFLDDAGYIDRGRARMPGDASTRSYARLIRNDKSPSS